MATTFHSVCIFCASAAGTSPIYRETAFQVGKQLASLNKTIVYGGGKVGLMGAVADGALSASGKVIGIIPEFMTPHEIAHKEVSELLIVSSMHERKLEMHERSDAVITLPGGFGTFEELFEILTWIQLGLYKKPVGILNVNGYYNALEAQIKTMVEEGLLKRQYSDLLIFDSDFEALLSKMENYTPQPSIFELRSSQT